MKPSRRVIDIYHNHTGTSPRIIVRSMGNLRKVVREYSNPTASSIQRMQYVLNHEGTLMWSDMNLYGLQVSYRFNPDHMFDKNAMQISVGAVNPVAILSEMSALAQWAGPKWGLSHIKRDPAMILMMNQLASIMGFPECNLDKFTTAMCVCSEHQDESPNWRATEA
jgi:hypothetical protein